MKCAIFFPAIFALLIITSCKKYQPDNVVTNCGNWTLGDSTYHAKTFGGSLYGGNPAVLEFLSDTTSTCPTVNFIYSEYFFPLASGVYPIDTNNQSNSYFTIVTRIQNQYFRSYVPNRNVTISTASNGNLNITVPSIWLYYENNGVVTFTDSINFSANLTFN